MDTSTKPPPSAEPPKTSLSEREQEAALMKLQLTKEGIDTSGMSMIEIEATYAERRREYDERRAIAEQQRLKELEAARARIKQRMAEAAESDKRRAELNRQVACAVHAERRFRESGVPERHRRNLDSLDGDEKWQAVRDTLVGELSNSNGCLIALLGKRGTGKTQLCVSVIHRACGSGKTGRYVKALDLFREIRRAYTPKGRGESGESEADIIDTLKAYDVLVIDECHQRGETDFEQNTLINLLDHRYDACKWTFLIANQDRQTFSAAIGDSVVSRIHETGRAIDCDWESYRKH